MKQVALSSRLEDICCLVLEVREAEERGITNEERKSFSTRAFDVMEGVSFRQKEPVDSVLWQLLVGLIYTGRKDGADREPFRGKQKLDLTTVEGDHTALVAGLLCMLRHPVEARQLCYLFSLSQYNRSTSAISEETQAELLGDYFTDFVTAASLFHAGQLLHRLEESEPTLDIAKCGLGAFLDRATTGVKISASELAEALEGTLTRLWRDVEATALTA
jgi:hypothetical protein